MPDTLRELIAKWRERAKKGEAIHKQLGFFDSTAIFVLLACADELEVALAALAPHYVHKDKLRELRDRCIEGAKLFANAEAASVSQAIGDKLTALIGDKP